MEKWFEVKNKLEVFLLILISFSFVFKITLATLPIIAILVINLYPKSKPNPPSLNKYFLIVFCVIFLLFAGSCLINSDQSTKVVIKSLGLIFIPLMFCVKTFTRPQGRYFIFSFLIFQFFHIVYVDSLILKSIFWDHIHTFEGFNAVVERHFIIDRPYFGLNCLIAISGLKYLLSFDEIKRKTWIFLYLIFIIISLFIVAARLAMFISVLLGILILIENKKIMPVLFLTCALAALVLGSKYTRDRIAIEKGEPRIVIWNCAANIIKAPGFNHLIGLFSNVKIDAELTDCYSSNEVLSGPYWWAITRRYNTHNQFLWFYISYGIVGLTFFLMVFAGHAYNYFKAKNIFSLFFIIIFLFQCFFENVLGRQLGIYLVLFLFFGYPGKTTER